MKRILVALDGSPRAPVVLAAAAHLAQLCSAKLAVYRAVGIPPDLPPDLLGLRPDELEAALLSRARTELDRLLAATPATLVESIDTGLATPWDGIVRKARERDADLVVIGSHGFGALDRVLGTTAAKVVNHTDRNVLIVRAPLT